METLKRRRARSAAAGTLLAAAALLLTACQSSGSPAAASSPASSAAAPASTSPGGPASAPASTGPTSPAAVSSASPSAAAQSAADTFLAAGQDINGTALYKPACVASFGCPLSGDSTGILYKMTWVTWSATDAVGIGTYKIDGCNPNCAAGTVYPVATEITLTDPVKACSASGPRWFWSHASFRFLIGLPKALQGSNGPQNPWTFSSVVTAATQSCSS